MRKGPKDPYLHSLFMLARTTAQFQTPKILVLTTGGCSLCNKGTFYYDISFSDSNHQMNEKLKWSTLASGIDVGQGINEEPGKFGKKNRCRALNIHVLCSK